MTKSKKASEHPAKQPKTTKSVCLPAYVWEWLESEAARLIVPVSPTKYLAHLVGEQMKKTAAAVRRKEQ